MDELSIRWHADSYHEGFRAGRLARARARGRAYKTERWLAEQDRIDREMWIWTKGAMVGALLVIVAYSLGKL